MRRDYEVGGGNVFRDLGLPDAEELDIKANLAIEIGQMIRRRRLSQTRVASMLGFDQPRVSALMCGHLEKFSMEKLCDYLRALGCDVDIRIQEKRNATAGRQGKLRVTVS
ncbi:MAG: helix-turn-helix domain-containing protein [Candidatus Binataceae bacterium]